MSRVVLSLEEWHWRESEEGWIGGASIGWRVRRVAEKGMVLVGEWGGLSSD